MAVARSGWRKLVVISVPAVLLSAVLLAGLAEVWVRLSWDPKKGTPGFFLSDAVRGQRLAPNYDGWFAGIPVHINSLGFRDPREYDLQKKRNTFRILVLGDSVTFGHGSIPEHTYPALLEQKLKHWRPDVDWQVWNAGVPGYDTSQELADLLERGPQFQPDLVVVGFFINDLADNFDVDAAMQNAHGLRTIEADAVSFLKLHFYSLEWYKRLYLTLAWKLSSEKSYRLRFENLSTEEELLVQPGTIADAPEQQFTAFDRLTDDQMRAVNCVYGEKRNPDNLPSMQRDSGWAAFVGSIRRLQALHASDAYRLVFFLNLVPPACPDGDVFYDGGSAEENRFFMELFGKNVPTVSSYDGFLHVRPSQMPQVSGHALGNANLIKAETLFGFLQQSVLPPLLASRDHF
jgi:hypothetical protein